MGVSRILLQILKIHMFLMGLTCDKREKPSDIHRNEANHQAAGTQRMENTLERSMEIKSYGFGLPVTNPHNALPQREITSSPPPRSASFTASPLGDHVSGRKVTLFRSHDLEVQTCDTYRVQT